VSTTTRSTRSYPRTVDCRGTAVQIDEMTSADRDELVTFVAALPPEDLIFVPRDLNHPKVIDAWMRALDKGSMVSLVARRGGEMVGCTAIATDSLGWSSHVGDLRILISPSARGLGLGRTLIQDCFAQALDRGLTKLTAGMTLSQTGAVAIFEELGFRPEAMLHRHVADHDGNLHDLLIMSHDVESVAARHAAFGMDSVE
jgi:GNAT superfamily N-acetyltransferase